MNGLIDFWANIIADDIVGMLNESNTPHDIESLKQSFSHDVSDEKMVPTERFLETAYNMMNEKFFNDELPKNLLLKIKSAPKKSFIGCAGYYTYRYKNIIVPSQITLNSSRMLTLHEWLEVVLHEMVHVYDYKNNSEHFLGYMKRVYDSHGTWFLNFGKQFEKDGFHVQKYCEANIGINTDDKAVKRSMNNSVFLFLDGMKTLNGNGGIIKISKNDIDKHVQYISEGVSRGRYTGLTRIIVLKSDNPNIATLKQVRMRNTYSSLSYYYYDEDFKDKYGPFEQVDTYDIPKSSFTALSEDKDEEDYETHFHIDDEYARKMYDNIKGVIDVEKKDDDSYEVSIA